MEQTETSAPDPRIPRAEQRLAMLRELADLGMVLARELTRRAVAAPAEPDADNANSKPAAAAPRHDPAESFARLSRAVRLTLTLEGVVEEQLSALIAGEAVAVETRRAEAVRRAKEARSNRDQAHEEKVIDLLEEVMRAEIGDVEAFNECHEALMERLDEDEAYADCIERPLRETVERLCADLKLSPDWSWWTGDGWTIPLNAKRPAQSYFNQPSRKPFWRDRQIDPDKRLE